jgi:hypothetical protein
MNAKNSWDDQGPNWYKTMVEFRWTVKNIMWKFGVTRAIAVHIQRTFPSYADACLIASSHKELCEQVGH